MKAVNLGLVTDRANSLIIADMKHLNAALFSADSGDSSKKVAGDYTSNQNSPTNTIRFFDDKTQIDIELSQNAIELLKSRFLADDFISLDDGSTALSGAAHAYVEGWYKDIAHKRGLKLADKSGDGVLSAEEFATTKSFYKSSITGGTHYAPAGFIYLNTEATSGYQTAATSGVSSYQTPIANELAKSITADQNSDGELSELELIAAGNNTQVALQQVALSMHLSYQDCLYTTSIQEILEKLKELKGDVDQLDRDEKEKLKLAFSEFADKIESGEVLSQAELQKMRDKMADFEEFDAQFSAVAQYESKLV